jgi:hypothetical protein
MLISGLKFNVVLRVLFQLFLVSLCKTGSHNQVKSTKSVTSQSQSCPPWTYRKYNSSDCVCGDSANGVVICNEPGSQPAAFCRDAPELSVCVFTCHCMSYSEEFDTVVLGECPFLCTSHYYYRIPNSSDQLDTTCSTVVPQNRTGQLCSKCTEGYAPSAYSYGIQCADCTNYHHNWIKYLLIAYLPVSALYLIVIVFQLNAASPSMSAYIFACQLISSPSYLSLANAYVKTDNNTIDKIVVKIVISTLCTYGIWNLDFYRMGTTPLCLHPRISTLQVITLDYVIAVYPLVLIFITYAFVRVHDRSTIVQFVWRPLRQCFAWIKITNISFINVFSTFFLLSYVKILDTSLNLLIPTEVVNMTGHVVDTYMYYDGSIKYFGSDHLPYAILAICMCVIFNIIPLLLLCFYPCRCFQSCLNYFQFVNFSQRLHTFVDVFQGHYKLEPFDCRYFSTFFLFLRFIGLLTFCFIKSGFMFVIFGLFLIPVTAFYATVRPYKNSIHNIIDTVILLVVILFCFASSALSFCTIEKGCYLIDISLWILSCVFFPFYLLVISVYKIFPKGVCKYFRKYIFCGC